MKRKAFYASLIGLLLLALLYFIVPGDTVRQKTKTVGLPVYNWLAGVSPDVETVHLFVPDSTLQHFQNLTEQATATGVLLNKGDYAPATLHWNTADTIPVSIRLKGDLLDHLAQDRQSYRIKVQNQLIEGMESFSLHHPNTRNFVYEWVTHKVLKQQHFCTLHYDFVALQLNGDAKGIYAVEEHFSQQLLKRNGLKPAPILRFDETEYWKAYSEKLERDGNVVGFEPGKPFATAPIDVYQRKQAHAWSDSLATAAVQKLEAWRIGALTTSEVFDLDQLVAFVALCDLLGAQHALSWRNVRFYYGKGQRLYPICFDADSGTPIKASSKQLAADAHHPFLTQLFADPSFDAAYSEAIGELILEPLLSNLLDELEPELEHKMEIINSEFPGFEFDPEIYRGNREILREQSSVVQN